MVIGQPYTDLGNARRLTAAYGDRLRWVPQWGTWLVWDGTRWKVDTSGEPERLAKACARAQFAHAASLDGAERKEAFRWALASEGANRLRACLDLVRTEPGIVVEADQLDADPWALNASNGTLDLRTGRLRPHDPAGRHTKTTGCAYEPGTPAPEWAKFLDRVLPDPDVQDYTRRVFGAALVGRQLEHFAPFLTGSGANGKTTLTTAMRSAFGEYAIAGPRDLFFGQLAHTESAAALEGRRLVTISETRQREQLNVNSLKALTGGDPVPARHLYGKPFEFIPSHTFVLATNSLPEVRGQDHGTWRRLVVIPFEVRIPAAEVDLELSDRLAAEASGVLSWAASGCLDWQRGGLSAPDPVRDATAAYRAREDHLSRWLAECCFLNPNVSSPAGRLLDNYRAWCKSNGEEPLRGNDVAAQLRDCGCTPQKGKHGNRWSGIELLPSE